MLTIETNAVNSAFARACGLMSHAATDTYMWHRIAPRDGKVTYEFNGPVATSYSMPWRRVLFSPTRDANPFFHLMEALWMLSGRDDAKWISQFSSKISQYAEDDGRFHGAYGRRWRDHPGFGFDQLIELVSLLQREPNTRRAVLAMWGPRYDLGAEKKDIPCNTHIYFKKRNDALHMTVCCRSNDIILGCYGANVVHFSILQEFVAASVGIKKIGTYTHISDSWHFYEDNPIAQMILRGDTIEHGDYYFPGRRHVDCMAIVNTEVKTWLVDLSWFMSDDWHDPTLYQDLFFSRVAYPMRDAWVNYKRGDLDTAIYVANSIAAPDWKIACVEWLERRVK